MIICYYHETRELTIKSHNNKNQEAHGPQLLPEKPVSSKTQA